VTYSRVISCGVMIQCVRGMGQATSMEERANA